MNSDTFVYFDVVGSLWARGYFVCSSGNVTDEVIAEYIANQGAEPEEEKRFKITE